MNLCQKRQEIEVVVADVKEKGKTIGFVPTMGALHVGHLSLIKKSLAENDYTIVSIFVNPTQFNNPDDLQNYPRTLTTDMELLATLDKDIIVFAPDSKELYQDKVTSFKYDFGNLATQMEGRFRPGHFEGVATVLQLFFKLILPDKAYFGEKDFQQLIIIKKLVALKNLSVTIIGCPIYREASGLAYSSRNSRLTPVQKKEAAFIYQVLIEVKAKFGIKSALEISEWVQKQFEKNQYLSLEYFQLCDTETLQPVSHIAENKKYRAFIAAYAGEVRLIDNMALN
ncbi:pantoate--beta-alanine ligase [Aquimarina sp. ERC-38]|uniref:pantoate--beta-alanine ligase n=1 Tax=Aquimarina sp. ERC-38 TaxID=2949996 RepID=UPI002245C31F|nr:pantoate--beta-alanine ligase [Aquimarina sp. ERC-38]UZO82159.1 pantoate--beta-alanine ligase [Aquimarina sp. ERC-38]